MQFLHLVAACCSALLHMQVIFSGAAEAEAEAPGAEGGCAPPAPPLHGRVRLRSRGRVARFRCDPSWQLAGARHATCIGATWEPAAAPRCIRNDCPAPPKDSNGYWIDRYKGASYTLVCNRGFLLRGDATLYCEDRRWSAPLPRCDEVPKRCDFEKDTCSWSAAPSRLAWKRLKKQASSGASSGPAHDHTLGAGSDGYYMYIDSSSSHFEYDSAKLVSPEYEPTLSQSACFTFWYYMHGITTGNLNVYQTSDGGNNVTRIFHKAGEQENAWLFGNVNITPTNAPFQLEVVVDALLGGPNGAVPAVALDDVALVQGGGCSAAPSPAPSPAPSLAPSPAPTPSPSSSPFPSPAPTPLILTSSPMRGGLVIVNPKIMKPSATFLPTLPPRAPSPLVFPLHSSSTAHAEAHTSSRLPQVSHLSSFSRALDNSFFISTLLPFHFHTNFTLETISPKNIITGKIQTKNKYISTQSFELNSKKNYGKLATTAVYISDSSQSQKSIDAKNIPGVSSVQKHQYTTPSTTKHLHFPPHIFTTLKNGQSNKPKNVPTIQLNSNRNTPEYFPPFFPKTTKSVGNKPKPTYIPVSSPTPKIDVRYKSETQAFVQNQRTTLMQIVESVKQGHWKTLEPSTKIKESTSENNISLTSNIAVSTGVLVAITVIAVFLGLIFSRRIKRLKKQGDMSEDSDVRFLTSDEALDFRLARPFDDDNEL